MRAEVEGETLLLLSILLLHFVVVYLEEKAEKVENIEKYKKYIIFPGCCGDNAFTLDTEYSVLTEYGR
jgi:hypothetical protein